jgi:uncharacterized protein (DUF1330 family)
MKGYLIANVSVTDPQAYAEYRAKVQATVEQYGGRFLIRGGTVHPLEGDPGIDRLVVIEFPSLDATRRWYESPEYAPLLKLRIASSHSRVALAEGYG